MPAPRSLPLAGLGVLLTRPSGQIEGLAQCVEQTGGKVLRFPVIEISAPADTAVAHQQLQEAARADATIFLSANAVDWAMKRVPAEHFSAPLMAIGAATARALARHGLPTALQPEQAYTSEALLELPQLQVDALVGKRMLIVRGEGGRPLLMETLKSRGAQVEVAEVYRRIRPSADSGVLLRAWNADKIDVAVLNSGEALRNLYHLAGEKGRAQLQSTPLVVVSERIAALAKTLGASIEPVLAARADNHAVVDALIKWHLGKRNHDGDGKPGNRGRPGA